MPRKLTGITFRDGQCDAEVLGLGLNASIKLDDQGPLSICTGETVSKGGGFLGVLGPLLGSVTFAVAIKFIALRRGC